MKRSTTIFLACLLGALSFYYFGVEKPHRNSGADLGAIQVLVLPEGDSVSWFQIQNRATKETMTLAWEGRNWVLQYPVRYPAENFLVQGMVNTLTFAQRVRRFPLKGKAPKELGLDDPSLKVDVESSKLTRRRSLHIGAESPVGGGVYARWEGEDEYFMILPEVKAALERTVYSIRRKKLFRVNWEEVDWIGAKVGGKEYRLEKKGDEWRGFIPFSRREIFLEKADDLIYAFQSLYVKEFLDGKNPEKKEFGLKTGDFLAAGKKEGPSEKLILGDPISKEDALYAMREKENLVLRVSQTKIKSLLQMFQIQFLETANVGDGQVKTNSGKNSISLPTGGTKPV